MAFLNMKNIRFMVICASVLAAISLAGCNGNWGERGSNGNNTPVQTLAVPDASEPVREPEPTVKLLNFDKLTGEDYEFILVQIEGVDPEKDLQVSKEWLVVLSYGIGKEPDI